MDEHILSLGMGECVYGYVGMRVCVYECMGYNPVLCVYHTTPYTGSVLTNM